MSTASSLTILTDVPAADRAAPSIVVATAAHGLIEYVQSAAPTGTFSLTFGVCNGVATYSAANPLCTTGTINYVTGVGQDMGDVISVLGGLVKENVYNTINVGPSWPAKRGLQLDVPGLRRPRGLGHPVQPELAHRERHRHLGQRVQRDLPDTDRVLRRRGCHRGEGHRW